MYSKTDKHKRRTIEHEKNFRAKPVNCVRKKSLDSILHHRVLALMLRSWPITSATSRFSSTTAPDACPRGRTTTTWCSPVSRFRRFVVRSRVFCRAAAGSPSGVDGAKTIGEETPVAMTVPSRRDLEGLERLECCVEEGIWRVAREGRWEVGA